MAMAMCALGLAACGIGVSPEERVTRGERLMNEGDYGGALVEIKNALQDNPDTPGARLALARVYLLQGNADAARRELTEAQKHGADAGRVAELQVRILQQAGSNEELLKLLDSGALKLPAPQLEVARVRALAGLHRCGAAVPLARTMLRDAQRRDAARVVLANCYAQAGAVAQAGELLEEIIEGTPSDAEAWLALGRVQLLQGKSAEALASWEKAEKHAAGRLTALQQLFLINAQAEQSLARGDLAGARAALGRMVRIAPQGGLTQLLNARLQVAEGEALAGETALRTLVADAPEFDVARRALAGALLATAKLEQALTELSRLASTEPPEGDLHAAVKALRELGKSANATQSAAFWRTASAVQLNLGQPAMSRSSLERAAQLGDAVASLSNRTKLELHTGNGAQALRLAQENFAAHADDHSAALLLARAQRAARQPKDALATLQKAHARQPSAATAMLMSALAREAQLEGATQPLQDWLARHPDDGSVRFALAEALRLEGRNKEAMGEYQKLLAMAPQSVAVLNNFAWLCHLEKDPRALDLARRAYQLAPTRPDVADTLAWLLAESGDTAQALKIMDALVAAAPLIEPETRYHHAVILKRAGRSSDARDAVASLLAEPRQFDSRPQAEELARSLPE